jgi:acyl-CoA reductase-like NAD-dependent aldehyde dehydrogenase
MWLRAGNVVGAELVRNPDVDKISFTGWVGVGKSIMPDGAETMKRMTLELGGKSPTIVNSTSRFDPIFAKESNREQRCSSAVKDTLKDSKGVTS